MEKYASLRERVAARLSQAHELVTPPVATDEELLRAHSREYISKMLDGRLSESEVRRLGFPWSAGLAERSRRSAGATLAGARIALEDGVAVSLAGGTHHAFADHGAGFCVFNDTVIAARQLRAEGRIRRALVIDLDVHQGDGTATLASADDWLFTFSLHGERSYPFRKAQSDLDVGLPDGCDDEEYLDALSRTLPGAMDRAKAEVVFYLAGADPFMFDRFGRLGLTKDGLEERDRRVFSACRRLGMPMMVTLSGGYARDIDDTVAIHLSTVVGAAALTGAALFDV